MTTTTAAPIRNDRGVSHEERTRNQERRNSSHHDECYRCGRGLTEKALESAWWVHVTDGGSEIAAPGADVDPAGDCGWFPLGSECSKHVPRTHRAKEGDRR